MAPITVILLLLCRLTFTLAHNDPRWKLSFWRRASTKSIPPEGFYDPRNGGGSWLTQVPVTYPPGQGEPINIVISAHSDSEVLVDSESRGGLRNYFLSFGFSGECLGQHGGSDQLANLGDGSGYLNETAVIRWNYGDPQLGTCKETIDGGNHFRYWVQNGNNGNSGAAFLAASAELPIARGHDIIPNGYNLARDWMIGNMTNTVIPTESLTNGSTYNGQRSAAGYTYTTTAKYVAGYLLNSSIGINHNQSVAVGGASAVDGLVGILTIKITSRPKSEAERSLFHQPFWSVQSLSLVGALCLLSAHIL